MTYIHGSHILGQFDVQVDSNHRWDEDRVTEIDVYAVSLTNEGFHATDTTETLASREVPNAEDCEDMWYGANGADEDPSADLPEVLPESVREAFKAAVFDAKMKQKPTGAAPLYALGDTVFLKEHRFPADVEAYTVNGGYIVNMANSGELGEFGPDEVEDYDQERWHRD